MAEIENRTNETKNNDDDTDVTPPSSDVTPPSSDVTPTEHPFLTYIKKNIEDIKKNIIDITKKIDEYTELINQNTASLENADETYKTELENSNSKINSEINDLRDKIKHLESLLPKKEYELKKGTILFNDVNVSNINSFFEKIADNIEEDKIGKDIYIYIESIDNNHYLYIISKLIKPNNPPPNVLNINIKYNLYKFKSELDLTNLDITNLDNFNAFNIPNIKGIIDNKEQLVNDSKDYSEFLKSIRVNSIKTSGMLSGFSYNNIYVLIETYELYGIIDLIFTDKVQAIKINQKTIYEIKDNGVTTDDVTIDDKPLAIESLKPLAYINYNDLANAVVKGGNNYKPSNYNFNKRPKIYTKKISQKKINNLTR